MTFNFFGNSVKSLSAVLIAASLVGCAKSPPPRFHSNLVQMALKQVPPRFQQQIANILDAMYGTPDDPFVLPETGLDLQKIQMAAGPVKGYMQGLFRLHCVHCHGITGDGMGPTAVFLNPYPRDYRQGLFKFKSTPSNLPPTHEDLVRTLKEGITGTAMPSFKLLPQAEVEALLEYVKYLSLRGQTELALINEFASADEFDPDKEDFPKTREFLVGKVLTPLVAKWQGATSQVTPVPPPPADFNSSASIERGKQIFYSTGGCVKCHGPTALGDGQLVWDLWSEATEKMLKDIPSRLKELDADEDKLNESVKELEKTDIDDLIKAMEKGTEEKPSAEARALLRKELAEGTAKKLESLHKQLQTLHDFRKMLREAPLTTLPPRENHPRNLRQGIFRGGRQPYELFYRLSNGIFPSQMPGQPPTFPPDDIWHLIDYVLDLPYEPGSQYYTEQHMAAPPRERL